MGQGDLLAFIAVPAFVARVGSREVCSFATARDAFDPARWIEVDLSKNPHEVELASVQIDAHRSQGGLTSIGPAFHLGSYYGAAFLAEPFYRRCQAEGKIANWPPAPEEEYQYQTVAEEIAPRKLRRYYGFKATVMEARHPLYKVQVWQVSGAEPQKTMWIDLADRAMCLAGYVPGMRSSRLLPGDVRPLQDGATVPLFLSWELIASYDVVLPKVPKGEGADTVPKPQPAQARARAVTEEVGPDEPLSAELDGATGGQRTTGAA